MFNFTRQYQDFFIPCFLTIFTVISFIIVFPIAKRAKKKGFVSIGNIIDGVRYLTFGKITLKIMSKYVGTEPLKKKVEKLIEREVMK